MSSPPKGGLRHRGPSGKDIRSGRTSPVKSSEREVVLGKTPSGHVFRVPNTHDVLTALFHPAYPKSHFDLLNLFLLGSQILLFLYLPRNISRPFFGLYFAFWRLSYDAGLGWILTKQSKKKWIVREVHRRGWLDAKKRPNVRQWIKRQLVGKMGKDYDFDELPLEYNTWLLFRQVVDVILLNDFVAYCMFAFACFRVPDGLSLPIHIFRWMGGVSLILFNLWVKTEAHDVVKDYGWYWGDVFFQRGALVFNGVFEMAPHPMYSVGYAGYYGLSLIAGSYPVLFVSLAAHAAQFGFLVLFENPHIERMYGQRKPIAKRTPISTKRKQLLSSDSLSSPLGDLTSPIAVGVAETVSFSDSELSTPSVTTGDSATDSEDLGTETEDQSDVVTVAEPPELLVSSATAPILAPKSGRKRKALSQHDLRTTYFRRDPMLVKNLDPLRSSDAFLILLLIYSALLTVLPSVISLSPSDLTNIHFVHTVFWTIVHYLGLGSLLRAQSKSKRMTRHFMKHYHYDVDDERGAVLEAFGNWKVLWNGSTVMSYVSFTGLIWITYQLPSNWTVGDVLLKHTFGTLLVGLHIWATRESYEVIGVFGWFFGDFFMDDFPASLDYTGIYRYLNNPELFSGAAWFGLALITGSKLVLASAVIRVLTYWWFLRCVESPHMEKLYGPSLRKESGFIKTLKTAASRNAAKHAPPKLTRVVREVKGTLDKVYEERKEAVEEFISRSKPKFEGVVTDMEGFLRQSKERLVIPRIAEDISSHDLLNYSLSLLKRPLGNRFHLGEPIVLTWKAPNDHSRRDWIGIYRLGANKSSSITKTSSLGMWVPVHDDEWDGDFPLSLERPPPLDENGSVIFKGNALPWSVGSYEIRYHHDGKYNVMAQVGHIEIYVDKPSESNFDAVYLWLKHVVPLCLDSDPSLIPLSCKTETNVQSAIIDYERDPDDFSFWSPRQAKRICAAIKQAFNVEYKEDVVVGDANLSALARRILSSRKLFAEE